MDSLGWRELITKFQKKSMHIGHSGMKLGLGGVIAQFVVRIKGKCKETNCHN
jgi:hypothetical protein